MPMLCGWWATFLTSKTDKPERTRSRVLCTNQSKVARCSFAFSSLLAVPASVCVSVAGEGGFTSMFGRIEPKALASLLQGQSRAGSRCGRHRKMRTRSNRIALELFTRKVDAGVNDSAIDGAPSSLESGRALNYHLKYRNEFQLRRRNPSIIYSRVHTVARRAGKKNMRSAGAKK